VVRGRGLHSSTSQLIVSTFGQSDVLVSVQFRTSYDPLYLLKVPNVSHKKCSG